MLFILTLMAALLALVLNILMNYVPFPAAIGMGFALSLFIVLAGLGGHLLKSAMFKKEHMSKLRYVGGIIVIVVLGFAFDGYPDMWTDSESIRQMVFLVWLTVLGIFILSDSCARLHGRRRRGTPSVALFPPKDADNLCQHPFLISFTG